MSLPSDLSALTEEEFDVLAGQILAERHRRDVLATAADRTGDLAREYADAVKDRPARDYEPGMTIGPGEHVVEDGTEWVNTSGAWLSVPPSAYPLGFELTAPPEGDVQEWAAGEDVERGVLRSYGRVVYLAVQAHTTQADWTPDMVPALWTRIADLPDEEPDPPEGDEPTEPEPGDEVPDRPAGYRGPWDADATYAGGDVVDSGGRYWRCEHAHGPERQGTWAPGVAHTVWTDLGPVEEDSS